MLELMQFIFSGFWTWLGTAILLAIICATAVGLLETAIATVIATARRG